jgi:hypothetical protein
MAALLERMRNERLLWLDDTAYSALLLAAGRPPWLNAPELLSWRSKAQRLLEPDIVALNLGALAASWIESSAPLRQAMLEKKRVVAPLQALLADESLRAVATEVLLGLGSSFPRQLLALQMPSPRQWLDSAFQAVRGEPALCDADDVDRAAVYVADFIRSFGQCTVHALLLEEGSRPAPVSEADIGLYEAVVNVAHQYRWDIGLLSAVAQPDLGTAAALLDFTVAPDANGKQSGVLLPPEFWTGAARFGVWPSNLLYAVVPPQARPETVLSCLDELRAAK